MMDVSLFGNSLHAGLTIQDTEATLSCLTKRNVYDPYVIHLLRLRGFIFLTQLYFHTYKTSVVSISDSPSSSQVTSILP